LLTEIFLLLIITQLIIFAQAINQTRNGNVFRETHHLSWLGIFVWGDALIIAPFWILASFIGLLNQNGNLFFLVGSLFWVIRSLGEVMYWLNQQFSNQKRNPPEKLFFYNFINSDAIWFIYQVFWQCIFVFVVIGSIFFGWRWIGSL